MFFPLKHSFLCKPIDKVLIPKRITIYNDKIEIYIYKKKKWMCKTKSLSII